MTEEERQVEDALRLADFMRVKTTLAEFLADPEKVPLDDGLVFSGILRAKHLADEVSLLWTQFRKPVTHIFMHPTKFPELRMFSRDVLDIETRVALVRAGLMGKVFGAHIGVDKDLPDDKVYFLPGLGPGLEGDLGFVGVATARRQEGAQE